MEQTGNKESWLFLQKVLDPVDGLRYVYIVGRRTRAEELTMYKVNVIHPNAQADFSISVSAKSKGHAHVIAYRRINDRFGASTLYLIAEVQKEA